MCIKGKNYWLCIKEHLRWVILIYFLWLISFVCFHYSVIPNTQAHTWKKKEEKEEIEKKEIKRKDPLLHCKPHSWFVKTAFYTWEIWAGFSATLLTWSGAFQPQGSASPLLLLRVLQIPEQGASWRTEMLVSSLVRLCILLAAHLCLCLPIHPLLLTGFMSVIWWSKKQ